MVFVEWAEVSKFLIAGICLLSAVVLLCYRKRSWGWTQIVIACVPLLSIAGLFVSWGLMIGSSNEETEPIYSPDGRFAVRISVGPFGDQAVELFRLHGLRKEVVYWGDAELLRWADSSHLIVEHSNEGDDGEARSCSGSKYVSVSCVQAPRAPTP